MFQKHCIDHDNCSLDLVKLRAAIKNPLFDIDIDERKKHVDRLKAEATALQKAGDTAGYKKATEVYMSAWLAYNAALGYDSAEYKTVLYSIRAHHRGRIHCLRRRQPDGEIANLTIDDQLAFIEGNAKILNRFLRPVSQPQTAA